MDIWTGKYQYIVFIKVSKQFHRNTYDISYENRGWILILYWYGLVLGMFFDVISCLISSESCQPCIFSKGKIDILINSGNLLLAIALIFAVINKSGLSPYPFTGSTGDSTKSFRATYDIIIDLNVTRIMKTNINDTYDTRQTTTFDGENSQLDNSMNVDILLNIRCTVHICDLQI